MNYTIRLYSADDATDAQKREAETRFKTALEDTLGDGSLVAPVYTAYRRIVATYGESPDPDLLSDAERAIVDGWEAAETAAVAAAFGTHRYMGDADYEIVIS